MDTRAIIGKACKGMSPDPQHVIRCLTEGFGQEIMRKDFTPLGDEVLQWCRIKFWHGPRANSYGQTSDEDPPKKSLTDAIIKAASHVGEHLPGSLG